MKRLTKSQTDRKLCGVCGGVAEYLGLDATLIRLIWAIASFTGAGVLFYIICVFIIPDEAETKSDDFPGEN